MNGFCDYECVHVCDDGFIYVIATRHRQWEGELGITNRGREQEYRGDTMRQKGTTDRTFYIETA